MATRFYCDNCGAQVDRSADRCPQCGRHFAFVRCPQCGFTAEQEKFSKGCPACGYCTAEQRKNPSKRSSFSKPGKLPFWVYIVAILGLAVVALMLHYAAR